MFWALTHCEKGKEHSESLVNRGKENSEGGEPTYPKCEEMGGLNKDLPPDIGHLVVIYSSSSSLDTLGGPAPRWKSASQSLLGGEWRRNGPTSAKHQSAAAALCFASEPWRWALLLGAQGSPAQVGGPLQTGGWPHGLLRPRVL